MSQGSRCGCEGQQRALGWSQAGKEVLLHGKWLLVSAPPWFRPGLLPAGCVLQVKGQSRWELLLPLLLSASPS